MWLVFLFSYFTEAVIIWLYSSSLFLSRYSVKHRLTVLSGLYLVQYAVSFLHLNLLNLCLYLIINFVFFQTQFKCTIPSACFHSFILSAFMGISEMLVYIILDHFAPDFYLQMDKVYVNFLFGVFSKLIFFMIICIIIVILKGRRKYEQSELHSLLFLIFIPASSAFFLVPFTIIVNNYTLSIRAQWIFAINTVLILISNLFVFGLNQYNQKRNEEMTELQLLLQKESDDTEYHKMLHTQNENQRILIHDMKNHLQSIAALNKQNCPEKIDDYIKKLLSSSNLQESGRMCSYPLLNSILGRCRHQCEEQQILFDADIRAHTLDDIDHNDLTSLFCNLLDNAFEAAKDIPDGYIDLKTSNRPSTPFTVITMINSCRSDPFSADGTLRTHKRDGHWHGFGLKSIRKTITKYHGELQMYYDDKTKTFHTIIILRNMDGFY